MGIIMVELKLVVLLLTWGSITWIVSCSCLAYMGKTIVLALRRQENISSAFFFPKIDEDALMVNVHSTAIQIIIIAQKTEKKITVYSYNIHTRRQYIIL